MAQIRMSQKPQTGIIGTLKLNDRWLMNLGLSAGNDIAPWASGAKPSLTACVAYTFNKGNDEIYPQPQDSLNAYEQQMAVVTVQTYTELAQIAEALHSGQISSERAEYLTRRCFELGVVRLQFLDTLHLIAESKLS
jgi:hypothetical protein